MRYRIIERDTKSELVETINAYLKKGWVPTGGVNVCMVPRGIAGPEKCYTQAITIGD